MRKSSQRLLEALQQAGLAFPLAVLIAQQQAAVLFDDRYTHLKLVGGLYDQVRPPSTCTVAPRAR